MSDDLVKRLEEMRAKRGACAKRKPQYPCTPDCMCAMEDRIISDATCIQELEAEVERLNGALDAGLRYAAGVTKIFAERFPGEELEGTDVQRYYDEFLPAARRARQSLGDSDG